MSIVDIKFKNGEYSYELFGNKHKLVVDNENKIITQYCNEVKVVSDRILSIDDKSIYINGQYYVFDKPTPILRRI